MIETDIWKGCNDVLKQEEILWYKKSREKWVRLGDRNRKFFQTQTIIRLSRNKIQGLFLENVEWCTDENMLQSEAISLFKSLFMAHPNTTPTSLQVQMLPQLGSVGVSALVRCSGV